MVVFFVQGLVEKFSLTKICRITSRYGTQLPNLIIGGLMTGFDAPQSVTDTPVNQPVANLQHCAEDGYIASFLP